MGIQISLFTNTFAHLQENKYQECLWSGLTKVNTDINSVYQGFNMVNSLRALKGEVYPSPVLQGGLV